MKKFSYFLFATAVLLFSATPVASARLLGRCPDNPSGWSYHVATIPHPWNVGCMVTYEYCCRMDPTTGEYSFHIGGMEFTGNCSIR